MTTAEFFELPQQWMDAAACGGQHELFDNADRADEASAICDTCPVRMKCAERAIATSARVGVWAGVPIESDRQSRRDRLQGLTAITGTVLESGPHERPLQPIDHGTSRGYRAHLRRDEDACEQCREAHRVGERRRPARKRARPRAEGDPRRGIG